MAWRARAILPPPFRAAPMQTRRSLRSYEDAVTAYIRKLMIVPFFRTLDRQAAKH